MNPNIDINDWTEIFIFNIIKSIFKSVFRMVNDVAKWGHIYMKENFDLNVCYRKVFEILSTECNMQKVINSIADYAEVSFLVVDIGGKVLAASDKKLDIGCLSEQEIAYNESMIKIISKCIECQNKNEQKTSTYIEDDGEYKVVNSIEVKGNTEGFCIEMISSDAEMSEDEKEMICQVNDITCQSLGMVLERYGTQVHYHSYIPSFCERHQCVMKLVH